MGAWDVTHGHEVPAACVEDAWLAAAVAGTASNAASAAATISRTFRHFDKIWQI
jgi:hypothetical protein